MHDTTTQNSNANRFMETEEHWQNQPQYINTSRNVSDFSTYYLVML